MFQHKGNGNEPPKRVTIRDVAKAAGVSVSTVSHVMNNYGDIGPETEKRVRKTMEDLNYYPNALAQRLIRNRSHLLQLFLFAKEGLQHPFFYEVLCGISKEAQNRDYELILSVQQADDRSKRWRKSLRRSIESRAEGLIIMGSPSEPGVFEKIEDSQIPAVFVDIPFKGRNSIYISSDNKKGARLAVEHLISLGHRKIAFLGGDSLEAFLEQKGEENGRPGEGISKSRFEGYAQALRKANVEIDLSLIGHGEFTQTGAKRAVLQILESHPDVSAIFAASDVMALGAMEAVRSVGREVPRDVAVVGYDDSEAASLARPLLTTVRQDGPLMGKTAVKEIWNVMNNPKAASASVILPVELVVRESCGGLAPAASIRAER
ncbi:MAG TPA: LacI family transcriptional regulator [Firmicutes bacterium]|nr:LacI family transcriptional regulator [Bacillota bacterium]